MSKKKRRPTMKEKRQAEADLLPWLMLIVLVILLAVFAAENLVK